MKEEQFEEWVEWALNERLHLDPARRAILDALPIEVTKGLQSRPSLDFQSRLRSDLKDVAEMADVYDRRTGEHTAPRQLFNKAAERYIESRRQEFAKDGQLVLRVVAVVFCLAALGLKSDSQMVASAVQPQCRSIDLTSRELRLRTQGPISFHLGGLNRLGATALNCGRQLSVVEPAAWRLLSFSPTKHSSTLSFLFSAVSEGTGPQVRALRLDSEDGVLRHMTNDGAFHETEFPCQIDIHENTELVLLDSASLADSAVVETSSEQWRLHSMEKLVMGTKALHLRGFGCIHE